jgi:hypothetical protein
MAESCIKCVECIECAECCRGAVLYYPPSDCLLHDNSDDSDDSDDSDNDSSNSVEKIKSDKKEIGTSSLDIMTSSNISVSSISPSKEMSSISDFSIQEMVTKKTLLQLLPSQSSQSSQLSPVKNGIEQGRIKNFYISFGTKHDHQWASYNKSRFSIYINDKNGPILHLYRGMTYYFHIDSDEESSHKAFMFTTSPCGGRNALPIPGGFNPITLDTVCFRVTEDTPRYFFYQNFYEEFQGGLVIIHG